MKPYLTIAILISVIASFTSCSTTKNLERRQEKANAKRLEESIPVTERLEPDYLSLGKEMIARNYYDIAEIQLKEAQKTNRNNPEVYCLLGKCIHERGDYQTAVKYYKKAFWRDGKYAPAYDGIAVTYYELGKQKKAVKSSEKAVKFNPGSANYLNNLGFLYMNAGELDKAEDCLRRSIVLSPGFKIAVNNLGICLVLANREAEALETFMLLMSSANAYNNVGAVYEQQGDIVKAIRMYMTAVSIDPDLAAARNNLERVNGAFINP